MRYEYSPLVPSYSFPFPHITYEGTGLLRLQYRIYRGIKIQNINVQ